MSKDERDSRGRFLKGTKARAGKMGRSYRASKHLKIADYFTEDDIQEALQTIRENLKQTSMTTSMKAAEYILDQVFGKARQSMEMSGKDGGPLEIQDARKRLEDKLSKLVVSTAGVRNLPDNGTADGMEIQEKAEEDHGE